MRPDTFRRLVPPLGPIFSLALIGLLLLSAVLYYRAVKIQRFLEPALAISEPRMRFTQGIRNLLIREFSHAELKGIKFRAGSIVVDEALLLAGAHQKRPGEPVVLRKLSRVFLTALSDPEMRENISLILVNSRYALGQDVILNKQMRFAVQQQSVLILNTLYTLEPELEKGYTKYFAATALPLGASEKGGASVEFRIVPTERLHIEVLQRLERYSY